MRYAFPCDIVPDDLEEREAYVVTFPDEYGATTGGWSWKESVELAEDVLGVALAAYVRFDQDIPVPSSLEEGQALIPVPLIVAAKLTLYTSMREQGITNVELAERLGLSEDAVKKLVNPRRHSHVTQIDNALRAVGRRLIVEDQAGVPPKPRQAYQRSESVFPVGAEA